MGRIDLVLMQGGDCVVRVVSSCVRSRLIRREANACGHGNGFSSVYDLYAQFRSLRGLGRVLGIVMWTCIAKVRSSGLIVRAVFRFRDGGFFVALV